MTAPVNISVLVPVYNVEPYLAQCLESICSQTLRELEIVCVDDASTDGSLSILREFAERDPRGSCRLRKTAAYPAPGIWR